MGRLDLENFNSQPFSPTINRGALKEKVIEMDEFVIRALLGGIGVAIICGPLGCLTIWQRMAYFGAALSHAALLGVALGLFFELQPQLSILAICIMVSCALIVLEKSSNITSDTALGILAHSSLAIGIVVFSLLPTLRMDLASYLFGDILAISWKDIYWIYLGGSAIMLVLARIWRPLLSLVIQRDLALVDGISETRTRFIFLILLSFVVAISMQIVGILLIVSLLIIPAATVRRISSSPEQMAVFSTLAGVISVIGGISISLLWDPPAGPSIVVASSLLYLFSLLTGRRR